MKNLVFAIEICPGNTTQKFKRVYICVMIAMNSVASNCFGSCATVRLPKQFDVRSSIRLRFPEQRTTDHQ